MFHRPLTALVGVALATTAAGCDSCSKTSSAPSAPTTLTTSGSAEPSAAAGHASAHPAGHDGHDGHDGGAGAVIASHELPPAKKPVSAFKPATSGFKFQNYGNEGGYTNLTVAEARRMFGDQICSSLAGGTCVPTPAAERWIESSNKSMGGGHCEGFAALALLIERGQIDPKLFGANSVAELEIKGNDRLQREIAYWFVTQGVMPMAEAEDKTLTPAQVAEKIAASLGTGETYTLGLYAPGYKMGHATTPYAVVDKGDDVVWIMHYDNNYPGEEKHVAVDKKTNVWTYKTAADPNAEEHEYQGDSSTFTLTLAPTSVRTGPLECHFCGAVDAPEGSDKGTKSAKHAPMREIGLSGDADLLITDEAGKRLGYAGGKLVNEIPGAFFAAEKSGHSDEAHDDEPLFYVPAGRKLKVTVDGTALHAASKSTVTLFGKGYALAVDDISVDPGQKDEIEFAADFSKITYTTHKAETPTLLIGIETTAADYEFDVHVLGETAGQHVELSIDMAKGTFAVKVKGDAASKPTLSVELTRIDESGEQTFKHKGVAIGADQSVVFGYAAWKGNKTPLHASVVDAKGAVVSEEDEADEE